MNIHGTPVKRERGRLNVSGSSAIALTTVGTNLLRIVSTMCLTRLLAPDVYGVVGMITSIFLMVNMLTDIGLQAYVVRHEQADEPHFLDAVFTIHAFRGVCLALIAATLAWPLSVLLAKPELFAPLLVSSFIFVIDGQVSLHQFRALRDGKVQRFSLIELITNVTQILTGIALAFFLRNVWAIVASMIVASSVRAWSTYALFNGRRHKFRRDRTISADLWRFSRLVAASSALTLVIAQVDKLALGRILSLADFGIYILAASLAAAPTAFAYSYASSIVYPAVAAAWRDGRPLRESYYGCWGRFFYLYAFAAGGLIGCSDLLVRILYDPRYLPVAHYLSILAVSTALTMVNRSIESVQVALGRVRIGIELNSIRLAWLVVGGAFAIFRSDPLTFVLTLGFVEVPAYLLGLRRLAGSGLLRATKELGLIFIVLAGVLVGAAASYVGRALLPHL